MEGRFHPITVDRQVAETPVGKRFGRARRVDEPPRTEPMEQGKRQLHLARVHGRALDLCASLSPEYICCGTHVLRALSNCPYNCTYCFLQSYLVNRTLMVVADTRALLEEVGERIGKAPGRFFRIGTWELGDSLALEPLTGAAAELVVGFAGLPNALLELRTKSDQVDTLLDLDHRGRTVISWTVSPAEIATSEEAGTASVGKRIRAMAEVTSRGYLTALHFDPILFYRGWESGYEALVRSIFAAVPVDRVAWISLGVLRFNPEMKKQIEERFPRTRITRAEMVLGPDGKVRYVKPMRIEMFRFLAALLEKYAPRTPPIYLCMERSDVWERVLGRAPASTGHLDFLIARSLYERYPGLVHESPDISWYVGSGL